MNFRLDINGLRAIAVIAVVFFHFNANWLSGGFAGVDVFFVISGYLMTGIILKGLEKNSFSVWRFYMARARRIIPALAAMILVLLCLGWFYLAPGDYAILSNHTASSINFISNVVFWQESGYFDAAAHEKWLLHTWSLSVEWQFYLIYPLILVPLHALIGGNKLKLTILLGAVIGFVFCSFATLYWPNPSFYLLPTRAWELLLGGVAFIYPLKFKAIHQNIIVLFGVCLILISYTAFSESFSWPGYYSLVPVFGTFLVMWANKSNSIITNNYVFQKVGDASYSIYLWHWPVVVAINYLGKQNDLMTVFIGLFISFVFGFFSYHQIEKRCAKLSHRKGNILVIFLFCLIVLTSLVIKSNNGVKDRVDESYFKITKNLVMPTRANGYCFYSFLVSDEKVGKTEGTQCLLGNKSASPSTVLFGDSFGGHFDPFWDEIFKVNKQSLTSITTNWCHPSLTDSFPGPKSNPAFEQCLINRKFVVNNISHYKNIIIAGSWRNLYTDGYFKEVLDFITFAAKSGTNVIIMPSPTIYDTNVLKRFESSLFNSNFNFDLTEMPKSKDELAIQVNSLLSEYASNYSNVFYLKRSDIFATSDSFMIDGITIPYSLDGGHITLDGSINSAKYFMKNSAKYEVVSELLK